MNEKHYNPKEADQAQAKFCVENHYPHFAPEGRCYYCGNNIYEQRETRYKNWDGSTFTRATGISVEEAGTELITGCPHCNKSYCD